MFRYVSSAMERIKDCPSCFTPPGTFCLRLINELDSTDLVTSGYFGEDSIEIYYYEKSIRNNVKLEIHTDSISYKSTIYSYQLPWISASGHKHFYLILSSHDTDTMYLDVRKKNSYCCTFFEYNSFKYNGQFIQIDENKSVYVIRK